MRTLTRTAFLVVFATAAAASQAVITWNGPFVGALSEDFESYQNYLENASFYEPEPFSVMGGGGSIVSATQDIAIWEPSQGATWGLINNGLAQPSDGTQGMGIDSTGSGFTLTFTNSVMMFGAYWGAASTGGPASVSVTFFDDGGSNIGSGDFMYDHTGTSDGVLDWQGWSSTIAIKTVVVRGDFLAVDSLQANLVPEPATMAVLGLGALGLMRRRRKA